MWPLSQGWYGDRIEASFRGRSVEEAQRLLDGAGLTSDFWRLAR